MSTVKDLNSILSDIFCNVQISNRSFQTQKDSKSSKSQSFWSINESAIFTESQLIENRRMNMKKSKLVKDTVNKGILLKKFKPINFITGFQNKLKIENKV